jgi:hypothetical protein
MMDESIATDAAMKDCPKRRDDLLCASVDGATVVLDRRANRIHQLNEVATRIWELCDGRHTPAQVAEQLRAAFEVDPATARRDVTTAIRQLEEVGLLESVTAR